MEEVSGEPDEFIQVNTMRKRKTLHIITRLDRGGSSENTLLTVINLNQKKYDCGLLYGKTRDPDKKYFFSAKSSVNIFVCIEELLRGINPLKDIKSFFKILSFIKKGDYDIVHTHSSKAGLLGRWAAWAARVPVIIHTPHGHVFYGYYGRIVSGLFVIIETITAFITDRIITLTERGKEEHLSFGVGNKKKIAVIHSGVDVDFIKKFNPVREDLFRKKIGIPVGAFIAGSMGRFTKVKGYEYFISAAEILASSRNNIYFMLAGEGELEDELKRLVLTKGLDGRFFFIPWQIDGRPFLYSLDIFVLSSLNEGMGKVVVEAMSAGLPVVGTDVGGVMEIVEDGKTGFVVPPADGYSIAANIEKLCADNELRQKMGDNGRERSGLFNITSMVDKIDKLYEDVLKGKGSY